MNKVKVLLWFEIKPSIFFFSRHRPSKEQFPIVVSQDCGHAETAAVIGEFGDQISYIKAGVSF